MPEPMVRKDEKKNLKSPPMSIYIDDELKVFLDKLAAEEGNTAQLIRKVRTGWRCHIRDGAVQGKLLRMRKRERIARNGSCSSKPTMCWRGIFGS